MLIRDFVLVTGNHHRYLLPVRLVIKDGPRRTLGELITRNEARRRYLGFLVPLSLIDSLVRLAVRCQVANIVNKVALLLPHLGAVRGLRHEFVIEVVKNLSRCLLRLSNYALI